MLRLATLLTTLSLYVTQSQSQSCFDTSKEIPCENCDFTLNKRDAEESDRGYVELEPGEWTGRGFVALSGTGTWSRGETPGKVPYVGLYCPGKKIGRTFKNLVPKREYFISFYAAERQGYGGDELLTVKVNGHAVADKLSPLDAFTQHTYMFTPDVNGEAAVEFLNDSPPSGCGNPGSASTVLFTLVKVYPTRDCGTGASCHNPLPPATTYTCRCDAGVAHGKAVVGGAAECTLKDDLPEQIQEVQSQVGAVERSIGGLSDDITGLQAALKATRLETEGNIESLQDRLTAIEGQLASLLAALKVGQVPNSALEVPADSSSAGGGGGGGADTDAPEIVADGDGSLNFRVQSGKRIAVNGDSVLTADDVTKLIRSAVEAALQNVVG